MFLAALSGMILPLASCFAQVEQTDRFEFPIAPNQQFEIVSAGDKGIFLHHTVRHSDTDRIWLIKLDTVFAKQWDGFIPIENGYLPMGKKVYRSKLYLLFRYRDYSRNNLLLFEVDESNGRYRRYEIRSFIPFTPSEFQVTGNAVLMGGYFNKAPFVLFYSLTSHTSKILPGFFNEAGELNQIRTYPDGTFDVLISARNYLRQKTIWIKNYDPEGNLLRNFALEPEERKHLIFGRTLKLDNGLQIVAGVYGNRSSEFSRGLFIARIHPDGLHQIRYYGFGDLQNFFRYMKANREKRVKNRIERRKIKGKKTRFNYRFLVHELVPHNNQYILLGEAFYPRYVNLDRSYYGSFFDSFARRPMFVHNGRIFDGYYYTHAAVMGFNAQGDLLWDNSFEINDVRTFSLEQFVKLQTYPDKIALFYVFDNNIRSKIISGNQVLEGKSVVPIQTFSNGFIARTESNNSKLEYWYSDYLYTYGIQDVVGRYANGRQRVFFINKISFAE